jgi:hypothetical protein
MEPIFKSNSNMPKGIEQNREQRAQKTGFLPISQNNPESKQKQ